MISFSSIDQTVHFLLKKKIITYNFSPSKIIQQVTKNDELLTRDFLPVLNRFIGVIYKSTIRFATFQSINVGCLVHFFAMAPKKKEYSFHLRETVIKHFLNGDSEHDIAGEMIIPRNSVHYIIMKYKKTKCIENIVDNVRPRCPLIELYNEK